MITIRLILGLLIVISISCSTDRTGIIFEDSFGKESQGELRHNVIQLPPPQGLAYTWQVLEKGYDPVNWLMVDELEDNDPKKGFWVIPPDSAYLQQAGRSHNSILFCLTPVKKKVESYDILFKQDRRDNDYIGYIIGAPEPALDAGIEFGYMTQIPDTDSTVNDAYISGVFGISHAPEMALMQTWIDHRIEVRGSSISWVMDGELIYAGTVSGKPLHGYFGIRQRYDRNTRYDDVKIVAH